MKLDPLPPIPSPPQHHWRQFRVKVIPYLAFAIVFVLAVWLWGKNLANPLLQGTAEGLEADVASPKAGRVVQLNVQLYQEVKAGDIIAVVYPMTPAVLSNTLALARAEFEKASLDSGYNTSDKIRYAQFQQNWMLQKAALLVAQSQFDYATAEFQRATNLLATKIISESDFALTQRNYTQAEALVKQTTAALEASGKLLFSFDPAQHDSPAIKAALAVAEAQFQLAAAEYQPITLTAPISGRVIKISALAGTTVSAASPIVSIASPDVKRIIGFIGLPLRIEPQIGMEVEIRSRGVKRVVGRSRISYVGPRIEIFNAPMRLRSMESAQERGLPIAMLPPPNLNLRPGELVDLNLLVNSVPAARSH